MLGAETAPDAGASIALGIDIGGTFTDVSYISEGRRQIVKVLSTPADYGEGFDGGISAALSALERPDATTIRALHHGTTVATNAILTRSGSRTALVTTQGFGDVLEIRRLRTPVQYSLSWEKPDPLAARQHRFEIDERTAPDGSLLRSINPRALRDLIDALAAADVEAVAVCLLHSYANPAHEHLIQSAIRESLPHLAVSCSSDVIARPGEYERTSTAVINAYLLPTFHHYVNSLQGRLQKNGYKGTVWLMESTGALAPLSAVREMPVRILESGPAAGVVGALREARSIGIENLVTLDIGGTTAKACLIQRGEPARSMGYEVGGEISTASRLLGSGGYAVSLPTLEIAEIGAGGGSIISVSRDSVVTVGPESAGAEPGPACYGRGGKSPTLTDAHVVLGRIPEGHLLGGSIRVSYENAAKAFQAEVVSNVGSSLEEAAQGALSVANAQMLRILKGVTVERGADPRGIALFAYGGMAGLHAADLATELGIDTIIIPAGAGVFSSYGLLGGLPTDRITRPVFKSLARLPEIITHIAGIISDARNALTRTSTSRGSWRTWLELGYVGHDRGVTISVDSSDGGANLASMLEAEIERSQAEVFGRVTDPSLLQIASVTVEHVADHEAVHLGNFVDSGVPVSKSTHRVYWGRDYGWHQTGAIATSSVGETWIPGPLLVHGYDYSVAVPPHFAIRRSSSNGNLFMKRASI